MKEKKIIRKEKKGIQMNVVFTVAVVLIAVVLAVLGWATRLGEPEVHGLLTYQDDEGVWEMTIPLDEDNTYDVKTVDYTVHLQVKDGKVAFINSPCPDHVCESFGWLNTEGAYAVCAPAQAYLEIVDK